MHTTRRDGPSDAWLLRGPPERRGTSRVQEAYLLREDAEGNEVEYEVRVDMDSGQAVGATVVGLHVAGRTVPCALTGSDMPLTDDEREAIEVDASEDSRW